MSHFKMPKSEINRIRKEFKQSKDIVADLIESGEKLKNFHDIADDLFKFFEELTGKKTNRDRMLANVSFYIDEGYGLEEMTDYVRAQMEAPYYKQNPEMFTIAQLFPLQGQDRINIVWDLLAHQQGLRTRSAIKKEAVKSLIKKVVWDEYETMFDPYEALNQPDLRDDLKEIAYHFLRQNEENLFDYAKRTYERRKEISALRNIAIAPPENLTPLLRLVKSG